MIERTLVVLKPDAIEQGLEDVIITELLSLGLSLVKEKRFVPTESLIRKHYNTESHILAHRGHITCLINYLCRGEVRALVLEGEGAIQKARQKCGMSSLPEDCAPDTIRYRYGKGKNKNTDCNINIVHSSDSFESAEYEISLWLNCG
ncbi:nucleoside-diphosphate kinase [Desulfosarcina sp. OttesenSCG-928-G10]|nr:nucleoside-diphosphate kinase [Desulfosarcina sp. OttesenSCG-928-G10]